MVECVRWGKLLRGVVELQSILLEQITKFFAKLLAEMLLRTLAGKPPCDPNL